MPREDPAIQQFIARGNIARWTEQLADSKDERQIETLLQLLEDEMQRLHRLMEETD